MRAMYLTSLTWFAPGVHLDRLSIALVGEGARRRLEQTEAAAEAAAARDQPPELVQQGARIGSLVLHVARRGVDRRQPRLAGREAARPRGVPLHRMAETVAAGAVVGRLVAGAVRHSQLVALVDERDPRQRQQQPRRFA